MKRSDFFRGMWFSPLALAYGPETPLDESIVFDAQRDAALTQVFATTGEAFNVKSFGAIGDGVNDDSGAIGRAITEANGGNVYIPPGTYLLDGAVHTGLPAGTHIFGGGFNSVLKRGPTFDDDLFTLTTGANDITFNSFQYDGNRTSSDAAIEYFIQGHNNKRLTLQHIYAHHRTDMFCNLFSTSGTNDFFMLTDCLFTDSFRRGVHSLSGTHILIANNVYKNINDGCIDLINADHAVIIGNTCFADGTVETVNDAIAINFGDHVTIVGNRLYTRTGRAVLASQGDSARSSGTDILITGNIIRGDSTGSAGGAAIVCTDYSNVDIKDNQIAEGHIYCNDGSQINIQGNSMYGSETGYVAVESVATNVSRVTIEGNYVESAPNRGFDFTAAAGRTISDVRIYNNRVDDVAGSDHGVTGRGSGTFTNFWIEGNTILGTTTRVSGITAARRNNRWHTDAGFGSAVLSSGTITVSTGEVEAADTIHLTRVVTGGTEGHLSVGTIVAGTSFDIDSSSGSDTSTIFWEIVH